LLQERGLVSQLSDLTSWDCPTKARRNEAWTAGSVCLKQR